MRIRSTLLVILFSLLAGATLFAQDTQPAPKAARNIARGETIGLADIAFDSAAVLDSSGIVGMVARRMIRAGEVLRAPAIGKPIAIRAGAPVTVTAIAGGITIGRTGTAMYDAGIGDSVRVRLNTRTMVVGVVRDASTVILP